MTLLKRSSVKSILFILLLALLIILWCMWFEKQEIYAKRISTVELKQIVVYTEEELNTLLLSNWLWIEYNLAEAMYTSCKGDVHCIASIAGVATAESSLFKKCWGNTNNCFGIMYPVKKWIDTLYYLKRYESIEESIKDFVSYYNKNEWYRRKNAQARLNGNYCTSACTNWTKNFNSWYSQVATIFK